VRKREGGRETEREIERECEKEGERELQACTSRKCGHAESLSIPHSVSQSACMIIILILFSQNPL
jgi:hypothetical protein